MDEERQVRFHYLKSPNFDERPLHGAVGGPSASGQLYMAVYTERAPLPKSITYDLGGTTKDSDEPLTESARDSLDGPVRFMHSAFYLTEASAVSLRDWLTLQIDSLWGAKE